MSVGNWLPWPDSSMAELPQSESFTAELHDPSSIPHDTYGRQSPGHATADQMPSMHSMQGRQLPGQAVPSETHSMRSRQHQTGGQLVQSGAHGQQQGSVQVSQAPDRQVGFHGERVISGPARAPARSKADKRRRQCLLEIERELLRHSSSDEEGCGGDDMQLPNPSAGKRRKTACTGQLFFCSMYMGFTMPQQQLAWMLDHCCVQDASCCHVCYSCMFGGKLSGVYVHVAGACASGGIVLHSFHVCLPDCIQLGLQIVL